MIRLESRLLKHIVYQARLEFAVDIVAEAFVCSQAVDIWRYGAGIDLIQDSLNQGQRNSVFFLEYGADGAVVSGLDDHLVEVVDDLLVVLRITVSDCFVEVPLKARVGVEMLGRHFLAKIVLTNELDGFFDIIMRLKVGVGVEGRLDFVVDEGESRL